MSENFEESPVSDGKMDISEPTTTSQESAGVSPINEDKGMSAMEECDSVRTSSPVQGQTMASKGLRKVANTENYSHSTASSNATTKLDNRLDNDPASKLRLSNSNGSATGRSELTIANSHPLMSPPGTDSDSENGHRRAFNFPDVVPENEPLRLANPPAIRLNKTTTASMSASQATNRNLDVTADCTTTCGMRNARRKISVLREPSPDLISSESEQDVSQYQANVEPNYQSVALISNNLTRSLKIPPKPLSRRKIPVATDLLSDDMSSLDSISNHSFDDDMEPNLASLSPSSSVMGGFSDKEDDFPDLDTPTNVQPDPIAQYTAEEERSDSRNWQKITLPDGKMREIDMKVIEPYKRVLSHGGYLKAGGHNAIVIFCACHLPDRSRTDYHYVMDNLFLYVVKTLEQLVTEDYVLVYLHGGSNRRNVPPFPWLKKCYQLLDRRLRKSLKNMYLVHPTFWLKSIVWMTRPFVSSKFWRKLIYVRSLEELYSLVSVEKAAIPDKVKNYDSKHS